MPSGSGWGDDLAFANGIGFTDIIKRPTVSAKELRAEEYAYGKSRLVEKIEIANPNLVIPILTLDLETVDHSVLDVRPAVGCGDCATFVVCLHAEGSRCGMSIWCLVSKGLTGIGQGPGLLMSNVDASDLCPAEIARLLLTDESHVRKVIHDFNERGLESLNPRYGGGRPRRITIDDEQRIVAVAGARPETLGVPCTRWSLTKLSEYLAGQGIVVSRSHLGRLLARAGLSFQRTRSWKASPDPDCEQKAARILALYERPPTDGGVVISFDEMGPISLRPHHGRSWAERGRPERHRATYTRRHGIRYLIAALDVHAGYLRGRLRPGRNGASTLTFMRQIRAAYPASKRIYWIQDNLSCHWTPAIRTQAEQSNVELVPTPTYASYLNRIESHFGAISEFTLKNTDYLDWDSCTHAMAQHIRYRNEPGRRAERIARRDTHLNLAA